MVSLIRNLPLPLYLGSVEMTRLYRVAHLWYSLSIKSDHPLGDFPAEQTGPELLQTTFLHSWRSVTWTCSAVLFPQDPAFPIEAFARDYSVTPRTNPAVKVETTGRVSAMAFSNAKVTLCSMFTQGQRHCREKGTIGFWSKGGNRRTSLFENGIITKKGGSTGKLLNY